MTLRRTVLGAILVAGWSPAGAHQVDEYLQSTFISLTKDSVNVEMFLTPGVAVLPAVLGAIDANGDGAICEAEQRTYADRVVRDLSVTVNGENIRPRLLAANFPSLENMKEGLGTIHLELKFDLVPNRSNRRLRWENRHQSRISAYRSGGIASEFATRGDRQRRHHARRPRRHRRADRQRRRHAARGRRRHPGARHHLPQGHRQDGHA